MFERGVRALRSLGWQRAMHSDRKQSGRGIHLTRAAFKANSSRVSPNPMVEKAMRTQALLALGQKERENQIADLTRISECVRKLLDHCCPQVAVNELCEE